MKLTVNRVLSSGLYSVSFAVGAFTTDEVKKMESFGVPRIKVMQDGPGNRRQIALPITQVNSQVKAFFSNEEEAKDYELFVVTQIQESMKVLRERKDDFTSTREVDL